MNPNIDPQTEGVLIAEIYRDTVMRVLIGAFDAIMDGDLGEVVAALRAAREQDKPTCSRSGTPRATGAT